MTPLFVQDDVGTNRRMLLLLNPSMFVLSTDHFSLNIVLVLVQSFVVLNWNAFGQMRLSNHPTEISNNHEIVLIMV